VLRNNRGDGAPADNSAVPFYGYYFRILTSQGKNAPGGVSNYVSDGKMTGGFAFIAYPAEYRSSGVKMFIAGRDGIVYEKDLGAETARTAGSMTQYDPDPSWHVADAPTIVESFFVDYGFHQRFPGSGDRVACKQQRSV
jgi:hypothetical protein